MVSLLYAMIRPTQDSDSSEDEWEYDDDDGIADWNSDDSFSHLPPEVYENFEKGMSIQATLYRTPVIYRPRDIHWRGSGGIRRNIHSKPGPYLSCKQNKRSTPAIQRMK